MGGEPDENEVVCGGVLVANRDLQARSARLIVPTPVALLQALTRTLAARVALPADHEPVRPPHRRRRGYTCRPRCQNRTWLRAAADGRFVAPFDIKRRPEDAAAELHRHL
jgi:hypothetical protein